MRIICTYQWFVPVQVDRHVCLKPEQTDSGILSGECTSRSRAIAIPFADPTRYAAEWEQRFYSPIPIRGLRSLWQVILNTRRLLFSLNIKMWWIKWLILPRTIAASNRKAIGILGNVRNIVRRGTTPCEMMEPFCLLLPITAFFRQIRASWLLWKSSLYNSSM